MKEEKIIDLTKILKVGQKVWCDMIGECEVKSTSDSPDYPIGLKNKDNNFVFTKDGKYYLEAAEECCVIWPSKDKRSWDGFKPEIPDKAPVAAWDSEGKFYRVLGFYDAKNKALFRSNGTRYGTFIWENYEIIENPEPWMIEAQKQLED